MKLFVQIPCLNEEATLPGVIRDIPRVVPGVDKVKVLVIDDGSSDRTADVARQAGADYVVRRPRTQGLAKTFVAGLRACLELGADIIVNTDGDHQYRGDDIPRLIAPIMDGRAEIVIGDRQVSQVPHFSRFKRVLQVLGSRIVSRMSHVDLPDVTSGFRAYSRDAALRLNVFSSFSYTLETLFLAGNHRLPVTQIPIVSNRPLRPSRLFRSLPGYVRTSAATIVRAYALYEPLRIFFYIGIVLGGVGVIGVGRFLYFYAIGAGGGHVQSLVLSGVFIGMGFQAWMLGILADLISINRRLGEEVLYQLRRHNRNLPSRHWRPFAVAPSDGRERVWGRPPAQSTHDPVTRATTPSS
jgi:glycosyltransferase involved in cell wall biosynthesis